MVEMKNDVLYPLFYILVTSALILQVAAAIVEIKFLVMNIIKNWLHNRMRDQWINDCLVTYIDKYIFKTIECEEIMQQFQKIKNRWEQLSELK